MLTERTVEIDAPAAVVWRVFADVENWPAMTESVSSLRALDGKELALGRSYAIKQPRIPRVKYKVTSFEPGTSWNWTYARPGNKTVAIHEVTPIDGNRTRVRQAIEQTGIVGEMVGKVMKGLTARYLDMEGAGLKKMAERVASQG